MMIVIMALGLQYLGRKDLSWSFYMSNGRLQKQEPKERRMPWWLALVVISLVLWGIAYLALLVV